MLTTAAAPPTVTCKLALRPVQSKRRVFPARSVPQLKKRIDSTPLSSPLRRDCPGINGQLMRSFPVFLLPLFRPRKAYFLPNSLAAAGVAKVLVCGVASLSLFGGSSRASQPVLYLLCVGSSPALACPAGASACLPVRALAPMHMGLTPTRMLAAQRSSPTNLPSRRTTPRASTLASRRPPNCLTMSDPVSRKLAGCGFGRQRLQLILPGLVLLSGAGACSRPHVDATGSTLRSLGGICGSGGAFSAAALHGCRCRPAVPLACTRDEHSHRTLATPWLSLRLRGGSPDDVSSTAAPASENAVQENESASAARRPRANERDGTRSVAAASDEAAGTDQSERGLDMVEERMSGVRSGAGALVRGTAQKETPDMRCVCVGACACARARLGQRSSRRHTDTSMDR